MKKDTRLCHVVAAGVLTTALAGCGHVAPYQGGHAANDPFEPVNRKVFTFNMMLDRLALKPISLAYRKITNPEVRQRVRNVVDNLQEPFSAANSFLQGDIKQTGDTTTRFMINSTFGLAGIFDVAGYEGIARQEEDFGQTLAVWGMGEGPYLMLPLLGPSSVRDTIGIGVEALADPTDAAFNRGSVDGVSYIRTSTSAVVKREQLLEPLEELRENSVDFYASIRSLYRQRRAQAIGGDVAEEARAASNAAFLEFAEEEEYD